MTGTSIALALTGIISTTGVSGAQAEATPVESRITEVTVFGSSASVRRTVDLPGGDGLFVLEGLPFQLDPASVRVRCEGGEIVGVEVRERIQAAVPDPRVQELRDRIRTEQRALSVLEDEDSVLDELQKHVKRLLRLEEEAHLKELGEGRVERAAWDANYAYLEEKLTDLKTETRELSWRVEDKEREIADLELQLGRFELPRGGAGVRLRDVVVDFVATARGAAMLDVEYVVGNAGWRPSYDLRAKKDLSGVELVYRAKVWQRSGEDWRDTAVLLSTARPQRGAQGPDPRPIWLSLENPQVVAQRKGRRRGEVPSSEGLRELEALGYTDDEAPGAAVAAAPPVHAEVQSEGLSVRFRLPRTETIESRDDPTDVLIGRADLSITPEHYCVPALDDTVWLRAKAKNTSSWVMLPGRASVYFGADFLGHARLDAVQIGQELELALGPDPGLVVTRTKLEDLREGSGIFSKQATLREAWRIEVENHGAFSARPGGGVDVIVHEVLPRAKDDRIQVEIDEVRPKLAETERWKKEREDKGVLTWVVRVAKGAKQEIALTTEIGFPENLEVVRR